MGRRRRVRARRYGVVPGALPPVSRRRASQAGRLTGELERRGACRARRGRSSQRPSRVRPSSPRTIPPHDAAAASAKGSPMSLHHLASIVLRRKGTSFVPGKRDLRATGALILCLLLVVLVLPAA